jgi:hypothetical protein
MGGKREQVDDNEKSVEDKISWKKVSSFVVNLKPET